MPKKETMTSEEIQAKIAEVRLEREQLELERTQEEVARFKSDKELRSRQNAQRQGQLRTDLRERAGIIKTCTHRQGGSPGKERQGKGPSAIRIIILPDESRLAMCANCPMRVFEPNRANKSPRLMAGETDAQRDKRVAEYHAAQADFDSLVEHSEDQLTEEAARPMHSGKTFTFQDGEGRQVFPMRPCDSYAQGLDNRKVS